MHDPELLVLDEPFSGLDPVGIDDLSAVLADHAHKGATVLFSSHQLDLVEHLCEAVAIVDQGRLVAAGAVEELTRGGQPRLAVRQAGAVLDQKVEAVPITSLAAGRAQLRKGKLDALYVSGRDQGAPVHGLEAAPTSLSTRLTGMAVVVLTVIDHPVVGEAREESGRVVIVGRPEEGGDGLG